MSLESFDELAWFFETSDFAVEAKFIKSGKPARTILGIFDNPQVSRGMTDDFDITIPQPKFTCRTADIPAADDGDRLKVAGAEYYVRVQINDGEGVSTLSLEKM